MADLASLSGADYAALVADAKRSLLSDWPVALSVPEESPAEVAARRMQRSVRPDGGRQEGGATKVLDRYVPHVLSGLASLPQRAFEASETRRMGGEYDPGPGIEATLSLMGTGSAFAQPGAVGIFGGRLAKTADHAALARAEEMAAKGAPREQIWNETGWFQGADQKWRFEIPDDAAKAGRDVLSRSASHPEVYEGRFGTAVDHPDLAAAYPDLSNMRVATHWAEDGGSFTPSGGVSIGTNVPENRAFLSRPSRIDGAPNIESPRYAKFGDIGGDTERGVALHEAQHAIQDVEGTARGGNPSNAMRVAEAAERARFNELSRGLQDLMATNPEVGEKFRARNRAVIAKDYDTLDRLDAELYADPVGAKIMELDWERSKLAGNRPADGRDAYERLAGEVEARNVQTRMNMTPEERRAKPPWLTEDVPADQQIVRFGSLSGPQESRLPRAGSAFGDVASGDVASTTLGSGATDKRLGAGLAGLGQAGERPAVTGAAVAKMPDETIAMVDPRRIDAAWQRDRNQYVGPDGAGGDPGKYSRAREFLTTADQFEAPSLRMNEGGVPVFEDGRHRFAVMRDLGMDRVPVAVDPYSAELARRWKLLGLAALPAGGAVAGAMGDQGGM